MKKDLLFIPGPVTCAEPVLAAMAKPMVDHRGAAFAELLERIARGMQPIFGTKHDVVILGSSGTGGLEAAVASMFEAGDKLLACPVGVFGERIIAIAREFGCDVEVLETPWGSAVDPVQLAARLAADTKKEITGILLTHNETSTGVQNRMAELADAIRGHGAFVVVDSVSGLAASDFRMDEWGFDVVVTASQKALAVPPGLAMVAVSDRAWLKMDACASSRYYFDLAKAREFAHLGQTPWTPPISIAYALDVAITLYNEEGPDNVWARHARYARAIRAAADAMGIDSFSQPNAHSVTVVALHAPSGVDVPKLRKSIHAAQGVVIGGGQARLKGKIIRIGTMGDLSQTDVLGALGALEIGLLEQDYKLQVGSGVQAALKVFLGEGAALVANR